MPNEHTVSKRTLCVCPKCGAKHYQLIFWTGRGTPRKYCPKHEQYVAGTDHSFSEPIDFTFVDGGDNRCTVF